MLYFYFVCVTAGLVHSWLNENAWTYVPQRIAASPFIWVSEHALFLMWWVMMIVILAWWYFHGLKRYVCSVCSSSLYSCMCFLSPSAGMLPSELKGQKPSARKADARSLMPLVPLWCPLRLRVLYMLVMLTTAPRTLVFKGSFKLAICQIYLLYYTCRSI
jgi:hypothetical protein